MGRCERFCRCSGSARATRGLELDRDRLRVRMGWAFGATVARAQIRAARHSEGLVGGIGVHGWRGHWLVNGAASGLVTLEIDPAGARVGDRCARQAAVAARERRGPRRPAAGARGAPERAVARPQDDSGPEPAPRTGAGPRLAAAGSPRGTGNAVDGLRTPRWGSPSALRATRPPGHGDPQTAPRLILGVCRVLAIAGTSERERAAVRARLGGGERGDARGEDGR